MDFEREFVKVDSALRAVALSDTIIHAGACSHMQIASLESLLPGTITQNCIGRGFTTEVSVENFQKVKDVVSNAINTVIAKIKELMRRFMDWFKGKDNVSAPEAKKIAVRVETITKDIHKAKQEAQQKAKIPIKEAREAMEREGVHVSGASKAWLESLHPTHKENEAIVKEWLTQTAEQDGNFMDAIVGSFDDDTFEAALFGIMMSGIGGSDYQIITGASDIGDVKYYGQVIDATTIVGDADKDNAIDENMSNKLFAVSHTVMAMHIDACKHNHNTAEISSVLRPAIYFSDPVKYNATVRACIANLFKPDALLSEKDTVFKDTGQVNKLLSAMARVKISLAACIPNMEEIIIEMQDEIKSADADVPTEQIKGCNILLAEMRYVLDYASRLNMLSNRILVGVNKFCDQVKRGVK